MYDKVPNEFSLFYRMPVGHGGRRYVCKDCNTAWADFPASAKSHCSPYAAAGVVCIKDTDMKIIGAKYRYVPYSPKGTNVAFTFG